MLSVLNFWVKFKSFFEFGTGHNDCDRNKFTSHKLTIAFDSLSTLTIST